MSFLSPHPEDLLQWRYLRRALILAAILGLIPGFYAFEAARGRRAWQAYEKEALQRGVKLKYSDFIPSAVPDAENFASVPIFEEPIRAMEEHRVLPCPFSAALAWDGARIPELAKCIESSNVNLEAWRDCFLKKKLLSSSTDDIPADILRALDQFAAPLEQLREAGRRPHCRFPSCGEKRWEPFFAHYRVFLESTRVFALRISALLAHGDSPAAYADFHSALRLITATREEPLRGQGSVRIHMADMLLDAVWGGLANGSWGESELRLIDADLAELDWLRDYRFALGVERAASNALVDVMAQDFRMASRVLNGGGSESPASAVEVRIYPSGWHYQSKVRLNRYVDELMGCVDPVQKRFFGKRPLPSSPDNLKNDRERFYFRYFAYTSPNYEFFANAYVRLGTLTDLARVACALERHRWKHGSYPAQLADLAPEFMAAVPVEIVNDDPYRYHLEDDGHYVLYSVGADLRDDGGALLKGYPSSYQKDWVWTCPPR